MKKIIALLLTACLAVSVLTACGNSAKQTESTTAVTPPVTQGKNYLIENNILISCLGQADENGVFVVPETVTMIAEGAFAGDETLKEVVIGGNVKAIGSGAFQWCKALEKVTMEEGVEIIGSYAFAYCDNLQEVILAESVGEISEYAFVSCTALSEISFEHIRSIGDSAFLFCSALERIEFSSALETISSMAFGNCSSLEEISFENVTRLEKIADYAFTGCSMLRALELPSCVKEVGILAFYECSRLRNITIPSSLAVVDYAAFNYTPWYQENEEDYLIVGDGVLIKCMVHPSELDLSGKGIKMIGGGTFRNALYENQSAEEGYKYAEALKSVVIPEGVREIGKSAFVGCYLLENVTLPSTLLKVDENAFRIYVEGFDTSTSIDFSACSSLVSIGSGAFFGCSGIETVTLPETVKDVGEEAFFVTKAYDNFLEKAAATETEDDNYYITGDGILLFAYVANGQTAIHIPEGVKYIAGSVFCGWDTSYVPKDTDELSTSGESKRNITYKVKELYLPESLERIGNEAFFRMACVQKVVLPNSLTEIGERAFANCEALSNISGGASIKEIKNEAFFACASIPHFTFSSQTEKIGNNVFEGCSSLKTVTFPEQLSEFGMTIFSASCSSLTKITLPLAARPHIYTILGSILQTNANQNINVDYYNED